MADPARLNVYNLGEAGVNLTKSPLHQSDGELLQAQNAIRSQNNVDGGIAKRESFNKLNSVALNGAVRGILSLPLPNPLAAVDFYAFRNGTPPAFSTRKSTGGTTWADDAGLVAHADANAGATYGSWRLGRIAVNPRRRRFYYFGKHDGGFAVGQSPPIYSFDGVANTLLCRLPGNPFAEVTGVLQGLDMLMVGQLCFISTFDGTTAASLAQYGSVYRLDENGQETRIGIASTLDTGGVTCMAWWLGKLWCGTSGRMTSPFASIITAGKVYSLRPFLDADWTADAGLGLAAAEPMVTSMTPFLGDLYVSTCAAVGTASKIRKRTPAGVWSVVYTNPDTGDRNHIAHLTVYNGALYAGKMDTVTGTAVQSVIRSTNGTAWTIDRDVQGADGGGGIGQFLSFTDDLYHVAGAGAILRRRAGVWTSVDNASVSMRGTLAYIRAKN